MEDHPKHEKKKKNIKAMPLPISIGGGGGAGAGRLGMGGIVLFGGALVTATIVSAALAFKIRVSSKKSRSPSPEAQSVDAPDQLEFIVKTNTDLPLDSQNQSSDGLTSMNEIMQTKTIPDSSPEEKQNCDEKVAVESGDGNMFSIVGEDEKNYANSVSEEKIVLAFVACQTELGFPIVDGVEEEQKKYCNQQSDTEEEEYKAIEGVRESMQVGALASDEERTAAMEAAGAKEEKEKDCEDEMINVANVEGELSTSDEAADDIVGETEEEEAINTVFCVRVENQETQCKLVVSEEACLDEDDDDDDDDDETITIQTQEMHQSRTFSSGSAIDDDDDRAAVREESPPPPNQLMMMNKEEQGKDEDKECEVQSMNKDKETPDAEAELLMITEDETGTNKVDDEILLIQSDARPYVTTAKSEVGIWADESVQQEEEASHMIEESMKEDDSILLSKGQKNDDHHKHNKPFTHRFAEAKGTFLYNSWYSELLLEISLVPTLLLIFMLLALGTALQIYLVK
ncbi:unnamed protein product [Lactuca virosa]|uniref:Uncharacterized protein n=1 Tax=Lactuca virosa TaxID=75947 RepID=A0AAU9NNP0_9ASTR|nr:unnamed protein product [Lactuca virosa]CAH1439383.1 unnamed protein product [Lactuca virosa]